MSYPKPKFHSKRMSAISILSHTLVAAMSTPHQYADTWQASPTAAFAAGFWAQKWPARRARSPDGFVERFSKLSNVLLHELFPEADRIQYVIQVQDRLLMVLASQKLVHISTASLHSHGSQQVIW